MFNTALLPNLVGVVALTATAVVLLRRSNRGLLVVTGSAVALWALHYALMGSPVGALTNLLGAGFIFLAAWLRRRGAGIGARRAACVVNTLLLALITALFWRGARDLLPLVGGTVFGISQFVLEDEWLRWGFILGEVCFGVFSVTIGSAPGLAVAAVNIGAGLLGLWRMRRACGRVARA